MSRYRIRCNGYQRAARRIEPHLEPATSAHAHVRIAAPDHMALVIDWRDIRVRYHCDFRVREQPMRKRGFGNFTEVCTKIPEHAKKRFRITTL